MEAATSSLYWLAAGRPGYRALNRLPAVALLATSTSTHADQSTPIGIQLKKVLVWCEWT
jgi:hypothetical protein